MLGISGLDGGWRGTAGPVVCVLGPPAGNFNDVPKGTQEPRLTLHRPSGPLASDEHVGSGLGAADTPLAVLPRRLGPCVVFVFPGGTSGAEMLEAPVPAVPVGSPLARPQVKCQRSFAVSAGFTCPFFTRVKRQLIYMFQGP